MLYYAAFIVHSLSCIENNQYYPNSVQFSCDCRQVKALEILHFRHLLLRLVGRAMHKLPGLFTVIQSYLNTYCEIIACMLQQPDIRQVPVHICSAISSISHSSGGPVSGVGYILCYLSKLKIHLDLLRSGSSSFAIESFLLCLGICLRLPYVFSIVSPT